MQIIYPTTSSIWLPSGNPIVWTLKEQQDLGHSMSALITVYVNDVAKVTLKYPCEHNVSFYVDIHDVVHTALSDAFINEATALTFPSTEWCAYKIGVRTQYYDTNNEQHITAETVTNNRYAWYASADFQWDKNIESFSKYFEIGNSKPMLPLSNKQFITEFPALWKNRTDRYLNPKYFDTAYVLKEGTKQTQTWFLTDGTNRFANYFVVYVFSKDKPHYYQKKFVLDLTSMPATVAYKVASVPVGVTQLNDITWTSVIKKSAELSSIITPTEDLYYCTAFTVDARDSLVLSETATSVYTLFTLDTCAKDEWRVLYKTKSGGWWQVRTHLKHYRTDTIKTTSMKNRFWKPANVDMRYLSAVSVKAETTITLNTNWLHQFEVDEVEEMLQSPNIYIVKNEMYIPAVLVDSEYQISDVRQDRLVAYTFTFQVDELNPLR